MTTTEPDRSRGRTDTPPSLESGGEHPATSENYSDRQSTYQKEWSSWTRKIGKARAKADGKGVLSREKARESEADDQRDQQKAESYQARLINPGRSLARSWRMYRLIMGLNVAGMVTVVGWNANKVATGLGGENPEIQHYAAELPFSLPLVVILLLQVAAAQNGRLGRVSPIRTTQSGRHAPTAVGVLEFAALAGSIAVCAWPAVSDDNPTFEDIATSALPPFSLVATAILMFVTTDLFSEIFREHRQDPAETASDRRRLELAMDLALDVQRTQEGDNPLPVGDDGVPSISAIGKRFKGEKALHQCAHDILIRFRSLS